MIKEFKGTGISLDFVLVIWNGPQREEILIAEWVYLTPAHVGDVKIKNQHEGRKTQTNPKHNTEMPKHLCLHLTFRIFNIKVPIIFARLPRWSFIKYEIHEMYDLLSVFRVLE